MKKRYLCPVCDQELTAKSYCPECHRFCREPVVYEGWLLPNESDQEGRLQKAASTEEQKSRHQTSQGTTGRGSAGSGMSGGKQVSSGGRVYDSRYMDACGSGHAHTYGVPNQDPHKKKRGAKKTGSGTSSWLVRVIVVLVIISVAAAVFYGPAKMFLDEITEEFGIGSSGDIDGEKWEEQDSAPEIVGDAYKYTHVVFSEEEVVAAGEPCNGFCHYDINGDAYLARLSEYNKVLWPNNPFTVEWEESDNQAEVEWSARDGDVFCSTYSSYRHEARVHLSNSVRYTVICDTATGEVMKVTVGADVEEKFAQAFLLAACALEPDRDRNEIWSEIGGFLKEADDGEYYSGDLGISEVYISEELSCYGTLECLPQYDKYQELNRDMGCMGGEVDGGF